MAHINSCKQLTSKKWKEILKYIYANKNQPEETPRYELWAMHVDKCWG